MDKHQERAEKVRGEIVALHSRVERTAKALRAKLDEADQSLSESSRYGSPDYWRLVALSDGMIKVRLLIEQNFNLIETFGLLATTRYMLELLVWFRLLATNRAYAFTYLKQLLTDKRDHAKEHLNKVRTEIELFRELQKREEEETQALIVRVENAQRSALAQSVQMIADEIDRSARRRFCLYSNDAKTRGFGYQAFLMEQQVIPRLEKEIEQIQSLKDAAFSQMPESERRHKPWKWKEQAAAAGMSEQFEFLYAYTSRLLHATPTSMTTNQKNLELDEIGAFLDFVFIAILEAIEISEELCCTTDPSAN